MVLPSQVRPFFRIKARRIAALDVKRLAVRRYQETLHVLRKASYGICFTSLAWFNPGRGGNRDGASACRTLRIEITVVNSK